MRFTDVFLRRPVLAIVVSVLIVVAGLQAVRSLNVRQYPRIESATVTVRTVYVGASADLVRGFITTPLERAIAAADGIDYIESQSDQGISTINVRLKLNFSGADLTVPTGPALRGDRLVVGGHFYLNLSHMRLFGIRMGQTADQIDAAFVGQRSDTPAYVAMSRGVTPNSRFSKYFESMTAPTRPTASPTTLKATPSRRTSDSTCARRAPSATRMPISCRRCVTKYV